MNPTPMSFMEAAPLNIGYEMKPEEGYMSSSIGALLSNPFSSTFEGNDSIPLHGSNFWNGDRQTVDYPYIPFIPPNEQSSDHMIIQKSNHSMGDQDEQLNNDFHVDEGSGSITSTGGPSIEPLISPASPSPSCEKSAAKMKDEKDLHPSCDLDNVSTSSKSTSRQEAKRSVAGVDSGRVRKQVRTRAKDMNPNLVHVCPICGKKFAKKYNQKIHQRRHQGDVPFLCHHDNCGKGFMWRSSFDRHLKTHSSRPRTNDKNSPPAGPSGGDCPVASDVAKASEGKTSSNAVINGVNFGVDHQCLESITTAVCLSRLNGSDCTELLNLEIDGISEAAENVIASRLQHVNKVKNLNPDPNNPAVEQLRRLFAKPPPTKPV